MWVDLVGGVSTDPPPRREQRDGGQDENQQSVSGCGITWRKGPAEGAAGPVTGGRPAASFDLVGFDVGRGGVVRAGPRVVRMGRGVVSGPALCSADAVLVHPCPWPAPRLRRRRRRLVEAQPVHVVQDRLTFVVLRSIAHARAQFGRFFLFFSKHKF